MNARDALPRGSRYELLSKIAAGGMATVYVARLRAGQGVSRLVAAKRAHPHLADDATFRSMFVAEARLAARIHHANVVAVQDIEEVDGELLVVMDYVEGASLAELAPLHALPERRIALAARVVLDAAAGLHAAHVLVDDDDVPLAIVHRDVSPHNMLVGLDGVVRVTDFGIAKSTEGSVVTATGSIRGKLAYMAPEYLELGRGDRRMDVFALGVVLWECLTGRRLFQAATQQEVALLVGRCNPPRPSSVEPLVPETVDAIVMRALARDPAMRFESADELRRALEGAAAEAGLLATHGEVATVVASRRREALAARRAAIRAASDARTSLSPRQPPRSQEGEEEPVEARDDQPTASLGSAVLPLAGVTVTEPVAVTRASAAEARSNVSPALSRGALFAAGLALAGALVIGVRWLRAPASSLDPSATTEPTATQGSESAAPAGTPLELVPAFSASAGASTATPGPAETAEPQPASSPHGHPKGRPLHRPLTTGSAPPVAGPSADRAPPNPYRRDAG